LKTVYLAHKFEQRPLGLNVQLELERNGIKVVNPFDRPEQKQYDEEIKKGGDFEKYAGEVVNGDLDKINKVDGVAALLFPNAIGTVMEIFYAGRDLKIPVFTWVTYDMLYKHPWIYHYSQAFTERGPWMEAIKAWGA